MQAGDAGSSKVSPEHLDVLDLDELKANDFKPFMAAFLLFASFIGGSIGYLVGEVRFPPGAITPCRISPPHCGATPNLPTTPHPALPPPVLRPLSNATLFSPASVFSLFHHSLLPPQGLDASDGNPLRRVCPQHGRSARRPGGRHGGREDRHHYTLCGWRVCDGCSTRHAGQQRSGASPASRKEAQHAGVGSAYGHVQRRPRHHFLDVYHACGVDICRHGSHVLGAWLPWPLCDHHLPAPRGAVHSTTAEQLNRSPRPRPLPSPLPLSPPPHHACHHHLRSLKRRRA